MHPHTARVPTAPWLAVLDAAGMTAGPVLRYDQTLTDPQVEPREMIVEMEHPLMGRARTLGQPAKFSRAERPRRRPRRAPGRASCHPASEGEPQ